MIPPLWVQPPAGPARSLVAPPQDGMAGAPTFAMLLVPPAVAEPSSSVPVALAVASAQTDDAEPPTMAGPPALSAEIPSFPSSLERHPVVPRDLAPVAVGTIVSSLHDVTVAGVQPADTRFAVVDTVPIGAASNHVTDARARVFNQDGFFGTGVIVAEATEPPVQASSVALPQAAVPLVGETSEGDVMPPLAERTTVAARSSFAGTMASPPPVPTRNGQAASGGSILPVVLARTFAKNTPARVAVLTPPRRPIVPPPTAFVAVAVRAVAHGIDVVARIDRHDPAAGRLSDEIAALLSRHGYASGRIVVLAPLQLPEER
ncbi:MULTISPECIES: hypothetical protein [unclassified Sphingomonas]|uniref:hypothetical protein n=1 Tax=unclassified Sphingomonas TaxID=196159 RepID=UPI000A7F77B5|nr:MULTISPECIES: hypothetical protein [unclassified Sphingomonas]